MPEQDAIEHGAPGRATPEQATPGYGLAEHEGWGERDEPAAGSSGERQRLESDFLLAMRRAG